MSTTYYHGTLKNVDDNGNVKFLYPRSYASDILMSDGTTDLQTLLGTADISQIGDGSVRGAISSLNSDTVPGFIVISSPFVELTSSTPTVSVSFVTNSDGVASVSSSDPTVATASVSENVVTITGIKNGNATITVSIPATGRYTAASATITVTNEVDPSFVPEVGTTYKLGSGAHTEGTADLECVVLDIIGTNAVCISRGIYAAEWPGNGELTSVKSTYFGDLASAVSGLYLPRGNADGSTVSTNPTKMYVYDGTSWVDTYDVYVKNAITYAAIHSLSYGETSYVDKGWTGTERSDYAGAEAYTDAGSWYDAWKVSKYMIVPSFILDLTKVKLIDDTIVDINAPDILIGRTYKLGSGAHTGGTADLECVVLDIIGTNAVCIARGLYNATRQGSSELSVKSTYFGELANAVSGLYLPRGNGGVSGPTTTTPTGFSVFNGTSWTDEYDSAIKSFYAESFNADDYGSSTGGYTNIRWLGTTYNASNQWYVRGGSTFLCDVSGSNYVLCLAPSFILDLSKVKLHGSLIVDINAADMPKIVTWAGGTDAEIVAMVQSSDRGELDLTDYWSDGEERDITLSTGETITFIISDPRHYELTSPTSGGRTHCGYTLIMKNCLNTQYKMVNERLYTQSNFGLTDLYNTLQTTIYNSLPDYIKTIIKLFVSKYSDCGNRASESSSDTLVTSNSYLGLFAAREIDGSITSPAVENVLSQLDWFKTASHRIADVNGSPSIYWLRTRGYYSSVQEYFKAVNSDGTVIAGALGWHDTYAVRFFACI